VANHSLYDNKNTIFDIWIDNISWDYRWYYVVGYQIKRLVERRASGFIVFNNMKKLWIIGDSFTGGGDPNLGNDSWQSWVQQLCHNFNGEKYYVSSRGSRDFQTILDIFLKNLKNISNDDFVILVLPALNRTRLPLKTPIIDIEYTDSQYDDIDDRLDYFVGTNSYRKDRTDYTLEEPLTGMEGAIESLQNGRSNDIWVVTNNSNASIKNYLKILESLKKYLPFEIFVWSWLDEVDSDLVVTKSEIVKQIGVWETSHAVYLETDGKDGTLHDLHFSKRMHTLFTNYIISKFPKHFQ